jgi:hypothetical protein
MANPIIRIKRGSSTPASLSSGELAIDLTNLNLFVGKADGSALAVGGSGTFATKTYADNAVSNANTTLSAAIAAEEAARIAADNTLTSDLATEVSRATAAEGVIAADLATETSNRTSADTALDGKITTEKNRIDAILSASQADKDSFAEIVSLINSVDTENDTAFAGYVTSNNAALAQEVTDRTNADTALGSRIDDVESDATAMDERVSNIDNEIAEVQQAIAAETSARQSAISSEATTRANADTTLQSNIDAEATARANADSALDSRVTALETTIDGGVY